MFVDGASGPRPHLQVDAGTPDASITIVDPMDERGALIPRASLRVVQNDTGRLVRVEVVYTPQGDDLLVRERAEVAQRTAEQDRLRALLADIAARAADA